VIRHYCVREWQKLSHGDGDGQISLVHAEQLYQTASRSLLAGKRGNLVLEHWKDGLSARNVVGIVSAHECSLEILPKIETLESEGQETATRERLIHMLCVALDVKIDSGRMAALGLQQYNLLEILIGLFANKLSEAVRRGMPRRYVAHEDDLSALRGRLNVARQFTTHAVNPSKLACGYDDFSPDIPLNQAMKAVVAKLIKVSQLASNRKLLNELQFTYADITGVPPQNIHWERITLDRTNERWSELVSMARLLLGDRFQTTSAGRDGGYSLLFDMNVLFESYITRLLRRALSPKGYSVTAQGGRLYCLTEKETGDNLFQTKPDIIIKQGDCKLMIVDTKWKSHPDQSEARKRGVSQADVYQMMAYGRIYGCQKLMLLYPGHVSSGHTNGVTARHSITNCDDELMTATIDVGASNMVVSDCLGEMIALELAEGCQAEMA